MAKISQMILKDPMTLLLNLYYECLRYKVVYYERSIAPSMRCQLTSIQKKTSYIYHYNGSNQSMLLYIDTLLCLRDGFKTQPLVDGRFCQPPGTGRNRRSTGGWILKPPLRYKNTKKKVHLIIMTTQHCGYYKEMLTP